MVNRGLFYIRLSSLSYARIWMTSIGESPASESAKELDWTKIILSIYVFLLYVFPFECEQLLYHVYSEEMSVR